MLLRVLGGGALLLPYLAMSQAPVNLPSETFKQQLRSDTAQAGIDFYSKRQAAKTAK
ncbi:hypothetical protein [Hymenobacter psychrotolerans]|uniref:Uncharacterized protein n=1 Tax=Hymenobacter psychrotolerans DSM 18569 TaxID=1121959 RepID=A0A1M6YHP3_9BACT|nr:hypothetical protein [Hymenobacter psychrotolerans]SHL17633.1 hypothetical protein SAMN02746009_02254 [Hymenobacter psychrotolerans DSM 18569]